MAVLAARTAAERYSQLRMIWVAREVYAAVCHEEECLRGGLRKLLRKYLRNVMPLHTRDHPSSLRQ